MSTQINDGGPAFPVTYPNGDMDYGMTLRDYFAAQTLAGILGSGDVKIDNIVTDKNVGVHFSIYCYAVANAMLAAREASK